MRDNVKSSLQFIMHSPPYIFTIIVGLIILYLTLAPQPLPDYEVPLFPYADKVVHFIMFGTLAIAIGFDVARTRGTSRRLLLSPRQAMFSAIVASGSGAIIEVVQEFMGMGRSAELADLLADVAGAFICIFLFYIFIHHLNPVLSALMKLRRVYEASFPAEERRPWHSIMRHAVAMPHSPFNVEIIRSFHGNPIGFITSWHFDDFTYIEHFFINPQLRGKGIGSEVLKKFLSQCHKPVVLEVEPTDVSDMARRRIDFYERCGFEAHPDFSYQQPPYRQGLPWVTLTLMTANVTPKTPLDLNHVVECLYHTVYNQHLPQAVRTS